MIPDKFPEIALFAAREVALRGVGEKKEYDYNIRDVLDVARVWGGNRLAGSGTPCDADFKGVTKRKQTLRLHNAWRSFQERTQHG